MASIMVVDSDSASRSLISQSLRENGHRVAESSSARAAIAGAVHECPDLMVCDSTLPDSHGVQVLQEIRSTDELRDMRVLITGGRRSEINAATALQLGADDFINAPLDMKELLARVDACLRRPATSCRPAKLSAGGIAIDDNCRRVVANGKTLTLARREYRLLFFLMQNQERVFSRQQLLVHVWDEQTSIGPRTVDVHIRRLRSSLEAFGFDRYLQTVRGAGYRFSLQD